MLRLDPTPLVRLNKLFPNNEIYAKCEFTAPSGCFKIRGAVHLLERLINTGNTRRLVVPSMGNTALGAATGAQAFGFSMTGVVPVGISRDKDEKLKALGVDLIKVEGGGSDLLRLATKIADETGGYFVHPHLDSAWTDGYREMVAELTLSLPECKTLVFPVGGGGLLMGILSYLREHSPRPKLIGCEPFNYPKYAEYFHERTTTIADGLRLESPHPPIQKAIEEAGVTIVMILEEDIRAAMKGLYDTHGLVVEPSSAITIAYVKDHLQELEPPICVLLTGENIARADFDRLIA